MVVGNWKIREHRKVAKWLLRHSNYTSVYSKARNILSRNPYGGEPLTGRCRGLWKMRVGEIRVIYEVKKSERVVYVWRVGLRENIYMELC